MDIQIIVVIILNSIISLIGTLAYSVRLVGQLSIMTDDVIVKQRAHLHLC